jgi:hypothetical protein
MVSTMILFWRRRRRRRGGTDEEEEEKERWTEEEEEGRRKGGGNLSRTSLETTDGELFCCEDLPQPSPRGEGAQNLSAWH